MTGTVAVIGEALVDILHGRDGSVTSVPGGSAANVAVAVGRLGTPVTLVTAFADDAGGQAIENWLRQAGVRLRVTAPSSGRTSTATARLRDDGSADYQFDIEWALAEQDLPATDVLHVGSIGAVLEPGADAVLAMVEAAGSSVVTFDPNIRPSVSPDRDAVRARVELLLSRATLVKASEEDLAWLYPGERPMDSIRRWSASGPKLAVLTRGALGAIALSPTFVVDVPPVMTTVADTVGAGDTFMGALIAQLATTGADTLGSADGVETLLRRCAVAASITVSRVGADAPFAAELATALEALSEGEHVPA